MLSRVGNKALARVTRLVKRAILITISNDLAVYIINGTVLGIPPPFLQRTADRLYLCATGSVHNPWVYTESRHWFQVNHLVRVINRFLPGHVRFDAPPSLLDHSESLRNDLFGSEPPINLDGLS